MVWEATSDKVMATMLTWPGVGSLPATSGMPLRAAGEIFFRVVSNRSSSREKYAKSEFPIIVGCRFLQFI